MLDGLSDVSLSSEQDSVGTGRSSESELVQGQSLTTGSDNSFSGRGGEFEGGNGELGNLGESLVVEDGTDSDDGLGIVRVGSSGLLDDSGEGDWGSVDLAHEESSEDDSVESRVGSSSKESVELER